MSKEKPGIFRKAFALVGKVFSVLRWTINILVLLVVVGLLFSVLGTSVKPLPERAPLRLVPSGVLVEERSYSDPLALMMEQSSPHDAETPVRDLTRALARATSDPRITALILDLGHLRGGGIAKLSEVGAAIESFKSSGKPVIAVADSYTQEQYYLASFADEILVNPSGGVLITGFGYYGSFFKSAADKLKVNFHVFRAGEFKSAVEPFTRDDMSAEARANALQWVGELWSGYTRVVETNRGLKPGAIDALANDFATRLAAHRGDLASLALDARLVDALATRPAIAADFNQRFGADDDGFLHIHHKAYLAHLQLPQLDAPAKDSSAIGLIVASGTILDGEQLEGAIGGDSMSRLLQQARADKSLKALVIRIDSPGGSAFASEVIRREIQETQQRMPVLVSMGSLAASGGYWIAAGADEIWAQPETLTGSIGVFGIVPTFEDSLAALGVNSDGVGTTRLADFNHLDRPLSPESAQVIQLSIDNIYRQFLALVAEGRQTTPDAVDRVARGRIWTGRQAFDIGLVDKLGNLEQTVAAAAARAGLETWTLKPITRPLGFQEQLLKQLAEGGAGLAWQTLASGDPLLSLATSLRRELAQLRRLNDPQGVYLQCFGCPHL